MQRGRAAKARRCGWGRSASPCFAASRNRRHLAGVVLPSRVLRFFFAVQHPLKAAPMDGQADPGDWEPGGSEERRHAGTESEMRYKPIWWLACSVCVAGPQRQGRRASHEIISSRRLPPQTLVAWRPAIRPDIPGVIAAISPGRAKVSLYAKRRTTDLYTACGRRPLAIAQLHKSIIMPAAYGE
jgi:hypothetical protein